MNSESAAGDTTRQRESAPLAGACEAQAQGRFVDHPIGKNVRLSDGQWHHLLCYRIMEERGAPPAETTGRYVEEVRTGQTMEPPWRLRSSHISGSW